MRSALLLPGHMRCFKYSFANQLRNIINTNNCDLFISTSIMNMVWQQENDYVVEENTTQSMEKDIKDFYGNLLKGLIIEEETNDSKVFPSPKQWQRLQQCNRMRKQYESSNGFKYDIVIRARSDLIFSGPLLIDKHDVDKDQLCIVRHFDLKIPIHDQFAYGTSDTMDVYCDLIDVFKSRDVGGRSEEQLYHWLARNNIDLKYLNNLRFKMVRKYQINEN